ncbi:uncharacterized protein [Clytia hemisphaerica]|uniref:uncharacterized protein isoform X2 n=1 Tax=Clytia hemisphaerica TaxID=252671 RepID=UPI0034D68A51
MTKTSKPGNRQEPPDNSAGKTGKGKKPGDKTVIPKKQGDKTPKKPGDKETPAKPTPKPTPMTEEEKRKLHNAILRTIILLFNVLIGPALRCFIFLCVSIQVYGGYKTIQHYQPVYDPDSKTPEFYKNVEFIAMYLREIIECLVAFALLTSLIEKSNGFLGRPVKESFFLYYEIGFTSAWTGLGFFFIITSNISDSKTIQVLLDQFCINKEDCHMDILYKVPSYTSFGLGIICMLVGIVRILLGLNRRPDPDSTLQDPSPYKQWTQITPVSTRFFLFLYFMVLISSTIFVAGFQFFMYYHTEKDIKIISNVNNIKLADDILTILTLNISHILVAGFVFLRLVKMFWYKPFKPIAYLTALLYLYSIVSFFSQLEKLQNALNHLKLSWNVHDLAVYLSMFYALFPIPYWGLFVSADFGRHDEKSTEQTVSILTLIFRLLRRILYPLKDFLSERKHWNTFLNTIAILLAISGGFTTMMSTRYEKLNISFKAKGSLQRIGDDFQEIHDKITDVANGFIIVAANLNPCLNYNTKPPHDGKSINQILTDHVTKKGRDGHDATMLQGGTSILQTLYTKGDDEFKKHCFNTVNNDLDWSGNTSKLCNNVNQVAKHNNFTMSALHNAENNSGTHPDCSNADNCLKSSDQLIPNEYTLSMNKDCEAKACGLFIAGIVGAFATSFIPFAGPGIAKGIQISLKTYKLIKQFGKVFKRVATQVKEKRKKISNLHKIFSKILESGTLVFTNNYQFYYFLVPTILLFLIAIGLGFYRRKRPNKLSKRLFIMFFLLLGVVCGIMTYLSWVFTDLMREVLKPFDTLLAVEVKEMKGMTMIKGGYLMATLSCLFFIVSAIMSRDEPMEQRKRRLPTDPETQSLPLEQADQQDTELDLPMQDADSPIKDDDIMEVPLNKTESQLQSDAEENEELETRNVQLAEDQVEDQQSGDGDLEARSLQLAEHQVVQQSRAQKSKSPRSLPPSNRKSTQRRKSEVEQQDKGREPGNLKVVEHEMCLWKIDSHLGWWLFLSQFLSIISSSHH